MECMSRTSLRRHKEFEHDGITYNCELCTYKTRLKERLKEHQEVHEKWPRFEDKLHSASFTQDRQDGKEHVNSFMLSFKLCFIFKSFRNANYCCWEKLGNLNLVPWLLLLTSTSRNEIFSKTQTRNPLGGRQWQRCNN